MLAKGLTIFRKIFLAYVLIGFVIIAISNALQYRDRKHFIEENFRSQGRQVLNSAVDYFQEVYNLHLIRDLRLIVESPTLDALLTSQKNEALIARPNVEKLFLQFTRYDADKYLSLRFIDAKGVEQVVAEGNRRVREYRQYEEIRDHSRDRLYAEIYRLFEEIRKDTGAGVIVSKPFLYENQWSMLAGVPKPDPEVLGFGGVVIVHVSLNGFYDYIASVKVDDIPIVKTFALNGRKLFDAVPGASRYVKNDESQYLVTSKLIQAGTNLRPLFVVKSMVPVALFSKEVHEELLDYLVITMFMLLLVAVAAYILSRLISQPIHNLVEATKRISNGDLSTYITVSSRDEIGLLTDNFNSMVSNLKNSNDRLTYEACHDVLTDQYVGEKNFAENGQALGKHPENAPKLWF